MITAYLNRIATAVPEHDVHDAFVVFAEKMLTDLRLRAIFRRMTFIDRATFPIPRDAWNSLSKALRY
jgi:hypothetical protein